MVLETYGIIYNKKILNDYCTMDNAVISSPDEINSFDKLKAVADDIQARKDEINSQFGYDLQGAFTSAGMDGSSDWRFKTHLANLPIYYEYKDKGIDSTDAIEGTYLDNYKQIWDLYITDSTCDPGMLSSKTGDEAESEFGMEEAVFYQNGSWEYGNVAKAFKDDELKMIPIYIGVGDEKNQGLCTGTENYWCVNKNAKAEDIQATLDFMYWLVKFFIKKMETDKNLYLETINQCFMVIIRDFKKIGPKLDDYTLSTLLTRMFQHEITAMSNIEKYRTSIGKAANARKVDYALDFYKRHGNPKPTTLDLKLLTGLSERVITDSLHIIQASKRSDPDIDLKGMASEDFDPFTYALQNDLRDLISQELLPFTEFERKCVIERFDLNHQYGKIKSVSLIARELNTTSNEVNKSITNVLNRLKRSQSLRSLIFGTKSVSKEKAPDRQNITNYFDVGEMGIEHALLPEKGTKR